jgi:hypothetical protein
MMDFLNLTVFCYHLDDIETESNARVLKQTHVVECCAGKRPSLSEINGF